MTKLCPRGKAAAKRKFKVYPSAYANAYASKICAGKIKDPSGVKRKDFKGPKPAKEGMMTEIEIERAGRETQKRNQRREQNRLMEAYEEKLRKNQGSRTGTTVRRRKGLNVSDVEKLMDAMPKFDDGGINYKKIAGMGMVGGHSVMGSPISVDVDGDNLTNASASAYYKDLLK
tara:strand:+ start:617 stop:1135 length:519 start_codon:yes stop_codon:yes gene_type:complete